MNTESSQVRIDRAQRNSRELQVAIAEAVIPSSRVEPSAPADLAVGDVVMMIDATSANFARERRSAQDAIHSFTHAHWKTGEKFGLLPFMKGSERGVVQFAQVLSAFKSSLVIVPLRSPFECAFTNTQTFVEAILDGSNLDEHAPQKISFRGERMFVKIGTQDDLKAAIESAPRLVEAFRKEIANLSSAHQDMVAERDAEDAEREESAAPLEEAAEAINIAAGTNIFTVSRWNLKIEQWSSRNHFNREQVTWMIAGRQALGLITSEQHDEAITVLDLAFSTTSEEN